MSISEVAQRLENIYAENGQATKAQSSLEDAGTLITGARDALLETGEDSGKSELPDSIAACQKAIEAIDEARRLLAGAVGGIAIIRGRVLGESQPNAKIIIPNTTDVTKYGATPSAAAPTDIPVRWAFRDRRGLHLDTRNVGSSAKDAVHALLGTRRVRLENLQRLIDNTPNLNERYAQGLASVRSYFADRGLEIAPIVVLGQEDFDQAQIILAGDAEQGTTGFFGGGHLIIRELNEEAKELAGPEVSDQFVIGTTAHEAVHSIGSQPYIAVRSEQGRPWPMVGQTGLHKVDLRERNLGVQGSFLEEGGADYVRVQFLASIDRTPRMDGHAVEYNDVTYVGQGLPLTMPGIRTFEPDIPVAYARAAKVLDNGRPIVAPGDPGIAGYGVELIDSVVPGFAQTLLASRTNPAKQAEVIKMINSLDPTLYRRLRGLPYSSGAFVNGLRAIGDAVSKHQSGGQ